MSRACGQYGMLCEHGSAFESVVSYDDRNRGTGAVRGGLRSSTYCALLDRMRNPPLRHVGGGVDKMDRSSPKGGPVHALYLLMGSKLVRLRSSATGERDKKLLMRKLKWCRLCTSFMPTRLRFEANIPDGTTAYIDLAKEMSKVQRKMVRQGQNFVIHGGLIQDANNDYTIRFNTAPQSWVVGTALRRGRKMWQTSYDQILKEGGIGRVKPKYWDWKVYLDQAHAGGALTLEAKDAGGNSYPAGEWQYSKIVSEDIDWSSAALLSQANRDADNFTMHIVGDNNGSASNWESVGLIHSWRRTRAQPYDDDPVVPSDIADDPLANAFDEADADDEKLDILRFDGDNPPYDEDQVPGDATGTGLERMAMSATSAANPIVPFNGFMAPHGLIQVHASAGTPGLVTILMDVEAVGGIY